VGSYCAFVNSVIGLKKESVWKEWVKRVQTLEEKEGWRKKRKGIGIHFT